MGDWQAGSSSDTGTPPPADLPPEDLPPENGGATIDSTVEIDILFVIDNSGSMGERQAKLVRGLDHFAAALDHPNAHVDYRIAFTTTDNGNPWCPGSTPEGGNFVLTSCRSRIENFTFGSGASAVDRTDVCTDHCPAELAEIAIEPTITQFDATPTPRRWLQRQDGRDNLPEGISLQQALGCFAPQGINGCGFEQPLESMYKALRRATTRGEPVHGFLRDGAALAILLVTDETDCSFDNDWVDIFSAHGNRAFWSVPEAGAPTSAVCWNAGVECSGGPGFSGFYNECHASNFDVEGQPVPEDRADTDAVLHPIGRYIDYLQNVEHRMKSFYYHHDVLIALIAGVPLDYPEQPMLYRDVPEGTPLTPQYQEQFGIGPGCSTESEEAPPSVREREFAESFTLPLATEGLISSICADDFAPAFEAIARAIRAYEPGCYWGCVADTDPSTEDVLEEDCLVTETITFTDGTDESYPLPKCLDELGTLPDGATGCYVAIDVYRDQDSASRKCIEWGGNLEFRIFEPPRDRPKAVRYSSIHARCEPSTQPSVDCPDL